MGWVICIGGSFLLEVWSNMERSDSVDEIMRKLDVEKMEQEYRQKQQEKEAKKREEECKRRKSNVPVF